MVNDSSIAFGLLCGRVNRDRIVLNNWVGRELSDAIIAAYHIVLVALTTISLFFERFLILLKNKITFKTRRQTKRKLSHQQNTT